VSDKLRTSKTAIKKGTSSIMCGQDTELEKKEKKKGQNNSTSLVQERK
jgi:hypothetical protein